MKKFIELNRLLRAKNELVKSRLLLDIDTILSVEVFKVDPCKNPKKYDPVEIYAKCTVYTTFKTFYVSDNYEYIANCIYAISED